MYFAIVHAIQSHFPSAIFDGHTRMWISFFIPERNDDGANAIGFSVDYKLNKDRGRLSVHGCVANVFLLRQFMLSIDDKRSGFMIVGGCSFHTPHVGAVVGLR